MDPKRTIFTVLFILGSVAQNRCQPPPVRQSYRAIGDIVHVDTTTLKKQQLYFEENHSSDLERLSLNVTGVNSEDTNPGLTSIHFLEFLSIQNAFIYTARDKRCKKDTERKWNAGPQPRKVHNGIEIFPVQELIGLNESQLATGMAQGVEKPYRGIAAKMWSYKFNLPTDIFVEVDAYWSVYAHHSPSKKSEVPLGFEVHIKNGKTVLVQFVNVYLFTDDDYNEEHLQPKRGTFCQDMGEPGRFPDVSKIGTLAYESEFVYEDMETIVIADAWIDPKNMIYRIDSIPIMKMNLQDATTVQKIVSYKQGAVYETSGPNPKVYDMKDLFPDPQFLFDPRNPAEWNPMAFFGTVGTEYFEISEINERGVHCMLYQGRRHDWPSSVVSDGSEVESLWEWCIANQLKEEIRFAGQRFPVLSLNIYVLSSKLKGAAQDQGFYNAGLRLTFHFHKFMDLDPVIMDSLYFDISNAFPEENRKSFQFSLKVSGDDSIFEDSLNDPKLLGSIKNTILNATQLDFNSLRVSKVKIINTADMTSKIDKAIIVSFILLDRHPDLAVGKEKLDLEQARSNLKSVIDQNLFVVEFTSTRDTQKTIKLTGEAGSLVEVLHPELEVFPDFGHSAGTMAAVAIVMILLGISLGAGGLLIKRRFINSKRYVV